MESEGTKTGDKIDKGTETQHGDIVRVGSRKSSGDVPKDSEVKKSSSTQKTTFAKKRVNKAPFTNTRKKLRTFRQGVKKFWDLWSGFTTTSAPATKKKKSPQTSGVPGFEEIACIDVEMPDIMTTDIDKIRTSCKQCVKNPPQFPTKEQVKSKLIAADKYYGVTGMARKRGMAIDSSESLEHEADYFDTDGKVIRPSWRFILERPLVEQYVLMTNYIRKISILSDLEGTQNDQTIEEEDSGSDTEYNKFAEKHKIETQNFLASMRAPQKKETAVQTSIKSSEDLVKPVSETSLYPDSGSSSESSPSKRELSVETVITSRDFNSPLTSDLENRSLVNDAARVKNAIKWWESKEPPQTSESFLTSCDSGKNASGSASDSIPAGVKNEPVKDTSGSGSDGMSIPVHNAAGKISLFKLEQQDGNQKSGSRIASGKPSNLALDTRMTAEKGTSNQKKVTFSPVVEYFNVPEKNNAVFSLPKEDEEDNTAETSRKPTDGTLQSSKKMQNEVQNKTLFTLSPNQNKIVLQLGSTPKEGNKGFSVVQNYLRESSGSKATYLQQQDSNKPSATRELLTKNATPVKSLQSSSSENLSTSPDTFNGLSSSDYRSSPERTAEEPENYGNRNEENKESSSNSSERMELKASPARFFKPGAASNITSLPTDTFFPEVPDIDDDNDERSYQNVIYREERRDVCSFPTSTIRRNIEAGRQLNSSANPGFVNVVIVRGTPHAETKMNQTELDNQKANKYRIKALDSWEIPDKENLQHRSNKQDFSKIMGSEQFYNNYTNFEGNVGRVSQVRQQQEVVSSGNRQTSVYSKLFDDLQAVASAPINIDNLDTPRNRMDVHQSYFNPGNTDQQGYNERTQQRRTAAYQEFQRIPKPPSGTQFLSFQARNDCTIQKTNESVRPISEEEGRQLNTEASYVDHQEPGINDESIHGYEVITTGNKMGPQRTSIVTSTLTAEHILRKISEELNYSSTDIGLDSIRPIRSGVHLQSQENVRDRYNFEDFSKFDILKMSQIYSSSSSFITPSEERMAVGLNKAVGTLFQPMLVEDITPEVSMMPSNTERSIVSADRIVPTNNTTEGFIYEPEANKCLSQELKGSEHEVEYRPLPQIQYPKQFEIMVPCYSMIGNMQYTKQNEVEIRSEEAIFAVTPQVKEDEKVIESSIEYLLQEVHETICYRANRNKSEAKNEARVPRQWLMDVIPTVIKTKTKTPAPRQLPENIEPHLGNHRSSATQEQADVKPVFKFLKKQKEMEKHDE